MNASIRHVRAGLLSCTLAAIAVATTAASPAQVRQTFEVTAPVAPVVASIGGKDQLSYELHLTNFADHPLRITAIVLVDGGGVPITRLEGDALIKALSLVPNDSEADPRQVDRGRRALAYINYSLVGAKPAAVSHRIAYEIVADGSVIADELALPAMRVDPRPIPSLGPPVRGGPWVAVYDPAMPRGHRRVVYATQGQIRIPGRFAVDFIRLDDDGRMAKGDAKRADQFYGYGAEVLAVADGVVVAARDDFAQEMVLASMRAVSIGDATGNYVALDIGDGQFAFYEHLQPGLNVRVGEKVKRGQVLGKLGLTGQGSEPHLHFHVADAKSPLDAEGRPFALAGANVLGEYGSIAEAVAGKRWRPANRAIVGRPTAPAANTVVRFAE